MSEEAGREAARRLYQRFHGQAPTQEIRVSLPPVQHGSALGRLTAFEYEVPKDWPSDKAGQRYRHEAGDTGFWNTGAKPLIAAAESPDGDVLIIVPEPGEPPFAVEDRGVVG